MGLVTISSGNGISSLQGAASYIESQMANDVAGTKYQMTVSISGSRWATSAVLWAVNQNLRSNGVKPWPGNANVASFSGGTAVFQWTK